MSCITGLGIHEQAFFYSCAVFAYNMSVFDVFVNCCCIFVFQVR